MMGILMTIGFVVFGLEAAWAGNDGLISSECRLAQLASNVSNQLETGPTSVPSQQEATSAREWLRRAIDVSWELSAKAEEPDTPELKDTVAQMSLAEAEDWFGPTLKRFPREGHVTRYLKVRPWSQGYAPLRDWNTVKTPPSDWPSIADISRLRGLLKDKDPAVQAMAAEALAILHQPEDVGRLGELLNDVQAAAPVLGYNVPHSAMGEFYLAGYRFKSGKPAADRLDPMRSWRKQTVALYAKRAIRLMTGQQFTTERDFSVWWKTNHDGRNCLWYWQERLEREINEADIATVPVYDPKRPGESLEKLQARRDAARAKVSRRITAELRQLSPEVEAKVRLLAVSRHAGGAPTTGTEKQFWPDPPALRLSADRLLDLLDRKNLWRDVPWDDKDKGGEMYNLLTERLGMWADILFKPTHIPRLRTVLKREHDNLWWSGQAALIIGISRLLPPAPPGKLDDSNSRDGTLRQAVLREPDVYIRAYCAKELVRVGLPANREILTRGFFAPQTEDNVAWAILQALAEAPLTAEKCQFLVDLLLDRRFNPFWIRPNTQMGRDMHRHYAILAVNAHAGRTLIDDPLKNRLVNSAQSASALAEVRRLVAQLGQRPSSPPSASGWRNYGR